MARQGSLVARWIVEDAVDCGGRGGLWRTRWIVEDAVDCGGCGGLWRMRGSEVRGDGGEEAGMVESGGEHEVGNLTLQIQVNRMQTDRVEAG
jgi:hypothetical protein